MRPRIRRRRGAPALLLARRSSRQGRHELFALLLVATPGRACSARSTLMRLDPRGRPARPRRRRGRDGVGRAGRAGDRQRPALPAAEGLRRDDAALAAPADAARGRRASSSGTSTSRRPASTSAATSTTSSCSTDGRLAVVPRRRARQGRGRGRRHGDGEVRVPRRSCASRPEPGAFLAARERGRRRGDRAGKFVTMVYALIDPSARDGRVRQRRAIRRRGSSAPDGTVRPLGARGLALGIEPGQDVRGERGRRSSRARRRPLHRRRDRGAARRRSCTARSGSTRCSPRTRALAPQELADAHPRRLPRVRRRRPRRRLRRRLRQAGR